MAHLCRLLCDSALSSSPFTEAACGCIAAGFINDYILNEVGLSPLVSGFFWDDVWNPTCNIHECVQVYKQSTPRLGFQG